MLLTRVLQSFYRSCVPSDSSWLFLDYRKAVDRVVHKSIKMVLSAFLRSFPRLPGVRYIHLLCLA